jgi:hypothetical protein
MLLLFGQARFLLAFFFFVVPLSLEFKELFGEF